MIDYRWWPDRHQRGGVPDQVGSGSAIERGEASQANYEAVSRTSSALRAAMVAKSSPVSARIAV
jgi:hypothetical protein